MLKLIFVAPNFRLRRVQKKGRNEQKMKNCVLQKKLLYFCVIHELYVVLGVNIRIEKIVWKRCVLAKKIFLTFRHQLRCAIFGNFVLRLIYFR